MTTPKPQHRNAMKCYWIQSAICAGGKLSVEAVFPGKAILRARMDWPGETPVVGPIGTGFQSAIEGLNEALQDDAAEEMRQEGAV